MSESIQDHLRRYPKARPSTLAMIEIKRAKTEQLKAENEARKQGKPLLVLIAGQLKVLARKAKELVQ